MTINSYLDSVVDSENKQLILFVVSAKGKRSRISTGIKVNPSAWNGVTIVRHAQEPLWNEKLSLFNAKVSVLNRIKSDSELNFSDLYPSEVKELYQKLTSKKSFKEGTPAVQDKGSLFRDLVQVYTDKYKNVYTQSKLRQYSQTTAGLERFKPNVDITEINQHFLIGYCDFLVEEGKENSTIKHNHIKNIKNIAKEAKQNGIPVSDDIASFTWKATRKQTFVPTKEEIEAIYRIEGLSGMRQHIKDSFILACDTGMRDSDLRTIQKEFVYKQKDQWFLRISTEKTGLDYSIPLSDRAFQILKKYEFEIPVYSQKSYNKEIKIIVRPVINGDFIKIKLSGPTKHRIPTPRYKMFSTHTGRRFFGRNWIDSGKSIYILMLIFGHSTIETTLKYISYQPEEITKEFQKPVLAT